MYRLNSVGFRLGLSALSPLFLPSPRFLRFFLPPSPMPPPAKIAAMLLAALRVGEKAQGVLDCSEQRGTRREARPDARRTRQACGTPRQGARSCQAQRARTPPRAQEQLPPWVLSRD